MIVSAFLQADDNPKKNYVSPALTALCGILVLIGAVNGNISLVTGVILFLALFMLAASDFSFERSARNPNMFTIAMVLGVLSGFAIGILFILDANTQGVPLWVMGVSILMAVLAAVFVYRYLEVPDDLKIPVYIYLVQAVLLLSGGLLSLYIGSYSFAVWGIFIFISDALVGLRAFPSSKRPIRWLDVHRILFLIIVLYYSAQFVLVFWALR